MSDIHITINGGNNQILPNATEAVQNFYGDRLAEKILADPARQESAVPATQKLLLYVDEERLPRYLSLLGKCQSAAELAKVVVEMYETEPKLTKEELVKERFIGLLLPVAEKLTKGKTIDNIRARINDVLASRPRHRM